MTNKLKRPIAFIAVVSMLLSMLYLQSNAQTNNLTAEASSIENIVKKMPDGSGTASDPYRIGNASELYWFADQVNSVNIGINAVLTDNIIVNKDVLKVDGTLKSGSFIEWTPIGNKSRQYSGTFDGRGYTVSGLYCNNSSKDYVGLFGYVGENGTVFDVGVVNSYFYGKNFVAGVCGANKGLIEKCFNTCTLRGSQFIGGVSGGNAGTIKNCYNSASVKSASNTSNAGGVCGYSYGDVGIIINCYNIGAVEGKSYVGGVCGHSANNKVKNSFYLSGKSTGGINGADVANKAEALTVEQFKSGEAAYRLSQGDNGSAWGQMLDTDPYPVLDSAKKVYQSTPCVGYTNSADGRKEHTDRDGDAKCDDCEEQCAYLVSLVSLTSGGASLDGADLTGGGSIMIGGTTTVTATAVPGYTFHGWYHGDTLVCTDLSFQYTPQGDAELTAKYERNVTESVTINGGSRYTVSVNGGEPDEKSTLTDMRYPVGTVLTVTALSPDFAYWQNEAGTILSQSPEYTFTVARSAKVTAVYNTKIADKVILSFISAYDQVIYRNQIKANQSFTVPTAPNKTGCDFVGWSINGGEPVAENVESAVRAAIATVLATESTDDDIIIVTAVFTAKVQSVIVAVTGGSGAGTYNVKDVVTIIANDPAEGKKFSHWTDGTNILGYNTSYSFYASKDVELTAVYVDADDVVEALGVTYISDIFVDTVNGNLSFVSMSTVPEGCTILMAGVIATSDADIGTSGDGFNDTTASKVRGNSWSGNAYSFTFTIKTQRTYYVRAYLVYTDTNGNTHTVYGNVVSASVND